MTPTQRKNYNKMLAALKRIVAYQSVESLRRNSDWEILTEKEYGIEYQESLEDAYENIQGEAKAGCKGVRKLK